MDLPGEGKGKRGGGAVVKGTCANCGMTDVELNEGGLCEECASAEPEAAEE